MRVATTLRALAALIVLGALLTGCGDTPDPAANVGGEQMDTGVAATLARTRNVMGAAIVGTGAAALASFPGPPPLDGPGLPTGRFFYDRGSGTWARQGDAAQLTLTWRYGDPHGHTATLTTDWADGQPVLKAGGRGHAQHDLPSKVRLSLAVDGHARGALDVAFGWHATPCGVVAQPDQLRSDGVLAGGTARLRVTAARVAVTGPDSAATIALSGTLSAASGNARSTVTWNATLHGSIFRAPGSCLPTGVSVGDGTVRLSLASGSHDVTMTTSFSKVARDPGGRLRSVTLEDGRVNVDGKRAFRFAGRLDDANHDGVPGENVTLVSASGARLDGEHFLKRSASGLLAAARAIADLVP